jgi:hypothetical protein
MRSIAGLTRGCSRGQSRWRFVAPHLMYRPQEQLTSGGNEIKEPQGDLRLLGQRTVLTPTPLPIESVVSGVELPGLIALRLALPGAGHRTDRASFNAKPLPAPDGLQVQPPKPRSGAQHPVRRGPDATERRHVRRHDLAIGSGTS